MTTEKLVPFSFEEFKADPSRLRIGRASIEWAAPVHGCVALKRHGGDPVVYQPHEFVCLDLVAKPPRKVKVRLFRGHDGQYGSASEDFQRIDTPTTGTGYNWASDIVEIEVRP